MRRQGDWLEALLVATLALLSPMASAKEIGTHPNALRVAAATTAAETGVIDALAQEFGVLYPYLTVEISEVGAIAALELGRKGDADLIITHDPTGEKLFVLQGYGRLRTEIMRDEFALFGPPADIRTAQADLLDVLRRLAADEKPFLAPSPRSGTAKKIAELWELAGVTPNWVGYEVTGTSAAATLHQAAQFGAYTIINMRTYLANRSRLRGSIVSVYRDHPALHNTYSAIVVDSSRVLDAREAMAQAFLAIRQWPEENRRIRPRQVRNAALRARGPSRRRAADPAGIRDSRTEAGDDPLSRHAGGGARPRRLRGRRLRVACAANGKGASVE